MSIQSVADDCLKMKIIHSQTTSFVVKSFWLFAVAFALALFSGCAGEVESAEGSPSDPSANPPADPSANPPADPSANTPPDPSANTPADSSPNPPAQTDDEPWSDEDLITTAALAEILEDPERENPVIFDIGGVAHIMGGRIKGAEEIGPTGATEYLAKLGAAADEHPEDVDLVIYCGCCPFKDCPNIRPAFELLRQMEFTNLKLLDIPENLRVDWVNRGYPTAEE